MRTIVYLAVLGSLVVTMLIGTPKQEVISPSHIEVNESKTTELVPDPSSEDSTEISIDAETVSE